MADFVIVGKPFGSVAQPVETYNEGKDGSTVITRGFRCLYDGWLARTPKRGAAHPRYAGALLEERAAKQIVPAYLCDVVLTYRSPVIALPTDPENPDNNPDPGAVLPPPRYEETASQIEIPIQQNSHWADFKVHWDFSKGTWKESAPDYLQGVFHYIVGSVVESETIYSWSQPASVSTSVGQLSADKHWLTISGGRRDEGLYWSRTLNRLYSARPWPEQIYS